MIISFQVRCKGNFGEIVSKLKYAIFDFIYVDNDLHYTIFGVAELKKKSLISHDMCMASV